MFKFRDYLKENFGSTNKFKKGDKVIYVGKNTQFNFYVNKKFTIDFVDNFGIRPYLIKCDEPGMYSSFKVEEDEIKLIPDTDIEVGDSVLYRTNRITSMRSNNKIGRVTAIQNNGETYRLSFSDGNVVVANKNEIKKHEEGEPIPNIKPKKGDLVLYKTKKEYNKRLNGRTGVVDSISYNNYLVKFDGEQYITYCDLDELTVINVDFRIIIGSKVVVNGKQGNILFKNRYGIVRKINRDKNGIPESYFIKFEEDESKNMREFSMMIDKENVEFVEKESTKKDITFSKGDSVICIKPGSFFNKTGKITTLYSDGDLGVSIPGDTNYIIILKPEEIKHTEDDFTRKIKNKIRTKESSKFEEEEEEEDVKSIKNVLNDEDDFDIDKDDLLNLSFKEFFLEEKLIDKTEFVKKRKEYESILSKNDISPFKKDFYEKSLKLAELVEQYFDFLEAKIVGEENKVVLRTLENIENDILLSNGTKVRASESKEMTKKYSFDSGIIVYWNFEDAVVFKTI